MVCSRLTENFPFTSYFAENAYGNYKKISFWFKKVKTYNR